MTPAAGQGGARRYRLRWVSREPGGAGGDLLPLVVVAGRRRLPVRLGAGPLGVQQCPSAVGAVPEVRPILPRVPAVPRLGGDHGVREGALPLGSMTSKAAVTRQPGVCVSSATARPRYRRYRGGPARAAVEPLPRRYGRRCRHRPPVRRSAQRHRRCSGSRTVRRAHAMSVNATAAPFHAAVADARDTAQAFIEDLRQPNGSRPMPRGTPLARSRRTCAPPDLYCGTRGAVCARLARLRHRPGRPGGPVHRIRSHAEA